MAIQIVKLKKEGEVVYPRTSTTAVNANPRLWNRTDWTYETDADGVQRLTLTEVLSKLPDVIDEHTSAKIINNSNLKTNSNNDFAAPSVLAMNTSIADTVGWIRDQIDSL